MAINEALGQPSEYQPTIADLNGLTGTLFASDRNIISIEGAQYLINLQQLRLYDNQISGLSALAELTNLQVLYLATNQISDLSPLTGLFNLQNLWLDNNQISDLSPLDVLTNLQHLSLVNNQISNISPLADLTNLRVLHLGHNQISDLSPLAGLTNLQNLDLGDNQISDLSHLAGLTHLYYLHLWYNQISDLSPLVDITNLQILHISYNQISDLSPLADLTNLRVLHLSYNQISDLSPLSGLTNLQELNLSYNPIAYESMLLSHSWTLPWSTNEYNPLSPCYPDPSRNATNVLVNYPLSWQGNYDHSQDIFYEVWLGISPDSLFSQGLETQMVNVTEHLYSFTPMLEPLTQYYWRIRAIAPTDTIWSGMWSFTTGEEFYQPIISVTPTIIYDQLTTAETSQTEITIVNDGTAPLIWNSNIVLTRAEQKTGTNAYLTKENNTERELHAKIENIDTNSIRDKDMNREGTSPMPEINLSPSSGTIEPNSLVICILNFIPGDSLGTYNYELQLSSNDPVSPLITVPLEYVVTSPIAYIPDVNFRMAINEALGQPSEYQPTIADLNGLTGALYAWSWNITSIEGAQYLTNLQELWLYDNQISDLSPLTGLSNLNYLYLNNNQISNISPLTALTNLQDLYLRYNQISDLSPLESLINLRELDLYYNQISDISPLAGLTHLNNLNLYYNQISDLSPLAGLTNLHNLYLKNNQISDLSPLAELTNLYHLELAENQISDISPLAGLTNLNYLFLDYNQISDLSPLAGMSNLQYLWLNYNQISDLSPLAGLTHMNNLDLYYNQISDLSPLAGFTNLNYLNLDGNPISYESMLLSQSWSLPWVAYEYNSLSPCYPDPSRNATNVLVNYPLSWQGNYDHSQDVFYEVWLGISPDSLFYQGFETYMTNVTEHLYSFTLMLEPLTQYYWRIKAVSLIGGEIWSGIWSFTTGEEFYQPIISVTPTIIYDQLTTAETSQTEITIANYGTATLIWNSNIVLTRAEQKTGTNAYLTKENNTERELNAKIDNIDANSKRDKDINREGTSPMPEINLSPSSGTIEPDSSVIC
ncbi:MAG: leucine-rich repeat domain-containing protein, partial [Candidatus Omnitrophota bacterium]